MAVVTERNRVPLMWAFLDHSGNSTTQQRIALMQRYLARFNASTVRMLLADRKFIGQEWFKFLKDKSVPFAIRVKEDQLIIVQWPVTQLLASWGQSIPHARSMAIAQSR